LGLQHQLNVVSYINGDAQITDDSAITRVDLRPTNAEPVHHVRLDVCRLARYVQGHPATG
jgi:hypothetical protein